MGVNTLHYLAVISGVNMQYLERLLLQCSKYFLCCVPISLIMVHNNSHKNVEAKKSLRS